MPAIAALWASIPAAMYGINSQPPKEIDMTATIEAKLNRLMAMSAAPPIIAIDQVRVNIDDLLHAMGPMGGIVRCDGDPASAILYVAQPTRDEVFDSIAGWISEDA